MAVSVIVKVGVKLLSTKKGRRFIVGIICAVFMLLFGITAAVWFIIASYFGLIGNAMSDVLINQSWSDINKYVDSALNDVNNTINGEIKETTYSFMPDFSINLSKAVLQQTLEKNNASTILLYDSSDIEKYDKLADEAITMLKAVKSQSDLNKIFPDKNINTRISKTIRHSH